MRVVWSDIFIPGLWHTSILCTWNYPYNLYFLIILQWFHDSIDELCNFFFHKKKTQSLRLTSSLSKICAFLRCFSREISRPPLPRERNPTKKISLLFAKDLSSISRTIRESSPFSRGAARSGARQPVERLAGRCGGWSCRFLSLAENQRVLLARKKTLCSVFRSSRWATATGRDEQRGSSDERRRAANLHRRVQS